MTPTVFALLVLALGLGVRQMNLVRWQVLLCLLGGTVAIALPSLGGAVIVVPTFFLLFFIVRAIFEAWGSVSPHMVAKPTIWLILAVGWGALVTFVAPRAWEGEILVVGIDRFNDEATGVLTALRPVSGNVSQTAYAILNVASFIAARFLLRYEERLRIFSDAVLLLATLNCVAAALNIAEFYLHIPSLLTPLRTAYKVFGTYAEAGLVRIHGTFPETSVFSVFTLTLLGFASSLWFAGVRPLWSGTVSLLSVVFLLLSTSGTAYGGLLIFGSVTALVLLRRAYSQRSLPGARALLLLSLLALVGVFALVGFESAVMGRVFEFFESTVVNKLESHSGETRSFWNQVAWQNFLDTFGLGVGFGTARPSSFFLTLLSNIGAVGTVCFFAFLYSVLRRPAFPSTDETISKICAAARLGLLAALSGAALSGSSFDRGALFYLLAACASRDGDNVRLFGDGAPKRLTHWGLAPTDPHRQERWKQEY